MRTHALRIVVIVGALLLAPVCIYLSILIKPLLVSAPAPQTPVEPMIASFEDCKNAGYPVMESMPMRCRTSDGRTFTDTSMEGTTETPGSTPEPVTLKADFGTTTTLSVRNTLEFVDGMRATLKEINDSRCKADVQCIWEGELSLLFGITGGRAGDTERQFRLSTRNTPTVKANGYSFSLTDATTETGSLIVTQLASTTAGSATSTAPTERYSGMIGNDIITFEHTDHTRYTYTKNTAVETGDLNTERGYGDDIDATVYVLNWKAPESKQKLFVRLTNDPGKVHLLDASRNMVEDATLDIVK
jgi:hypothetical protein